MNRLQIRKEVQRILRDSDYPKEAIDRAINSVISTVNSLGRFKFHQTKYDVTILAGTSSYALPTNFISEELVVWNPDTDDEVILTKPPGLTQPIYELWCTSTGDTPENYVIWAGNIWINPVPTAATALYKVRVYGYFDVAALTSDITAPGMPPAYHTSILAWGAAAEINPTLIVSTGGRQTAIRDIFDLNLRSMMKREAWDPHIRMSAVKDERWQDMTEMGHIRSTR